MLREVIEEGTVERFGEVLAALEQCGSLAYARDQAVREAQCAQDAIRSFPDSKFRDSLIDFAAFAVARDV